MQNRSQGSKAKQEVMRLRMPDICGAQPATALLRRRTAHLLRREGPDDAVDSMETEEESFPQATDMHAAISHEHTADDAAIPLQSSASRTPLELQKKMPPRPVYIDGVVSINGFQKFTQIIQREQKLCAEAESTAVVGRPPE